MRKKVVALMLGVVMTVSALAGCGSDTNASNGSTTTKQSQVQKPEEITVDHFAGTELNIVVLKKPADTSTDHNEKEIIKLVEKATGIHVNWTYLDNATFQEKISVMLMSGNQPDAYLGCVNQDTLTANAELFYDLSEDGLLKKWAPNVVADYDSVDGAWKAIKWKDGAIRSLITGTLVANSIDWGSCPLVINQAWLDKLGKDVPKNADELYEVLVAFRDNDMDGDGNKNNEIPLTFCSSYYQGDLMLQAEAFAVFGQNAYKPLIQNGKVVSSFDTDNFRAFLEFFHKLAEENLLDLEGFSQTQDQFIAKRNEKIAGVFTTYAAPMADGYTPFMYQGIEGVEPRMGGVVNGFTGQRTGFTISASSDKVEALLHWWNYMSSSQELKATAFASTKGFEIDENGKCWRVAVSNNENYILALDNLCPALTKADFPQFTDSTMSPAGMVRINFLEENVDRLNHEGYPVIFGDPAAAEERTFLEVELKAYITSFVADSILNGVTDASWKKHLEDLKTVQHEEWLQAYQDFYDEAK